MRRAGIIVTLLLSLWLAVAWTVGAQGLLANARPPLPQILVGVLTLVALSLTLFVRLLRDWADLVPARLLLALHVTRLVGIYFLLLAQRGQLPASFAIPAGWGDIAVAITALFLLVTIRPDTVPRRSLFAIWNLFGLVDILFVVGMAAHTALADPASMHLLLQIPLCLLPTFLVPLIIVSHLLLLRRFYYLSRFPDWPQKG